MTSPDCIVDFITSDLSVKTLTFPSGCLLYYYFYSLFHDI